ncbi:MAG: hypothetical protein AAFY26_19235 [Cyanobacteria bacterium J06638_22]
MNRGVLKPTVHPSETQEMATRTNIYPLSIATEEGRSPLLTSVNRPIPRPLPLSIIAI